MESIIIFKDRSKKEISNATHEKLLQASTNSQTFILGGCSYSFDSADKILYDYEYYEQYPADRPIIYTNPIALPAPNLSVEQSKQSRIAHLRGIISGVEKTNARELLGQLQKKLVAVVNGNDMPLSVDRYL